MQRNDNHSGIVCVGVFLIYVLPIFGEIKVNMMIAPRFAFNVFFISRNLNCQSVFLDSNYVVKIAGRFYFTFVRLLLVGKLY